MSKVLSLFSSSSGNSFLINCKGSNLLIDAGVCSKTLTKQLDEFGVALNSIQGVVLTHEHIDHVKGVRVFCDKNNIPLYASKGTLEELENRGFLPHKARINTVRDEFQIGNFLITPFATPHDCRESFGYTVITDDGKKIAVCTDLGHITPTVNNALTGSNFVFLESNHDIDMLKNGNYPASLKQRILGMFGHLSNKACDEILLPLIESGTTQIMLGHISQENNSVALALSCARKTLAMDGLTENRDYFLSAADVEGNGKFCVV